MAHVKALNKAKNKSLDDGPESPHHTPITGRGRNGDSDDDEPVSHLFFDTEQSKSIHVPIIMSEVALRRVPMDNLLHMYNARRGK